MLGRGRSLDRAGTRDAHFWRCSLVVRAVTGMGVGPRGRLRSRPRSESSPGLHPPHPSCTDMTQTHSDCSC